MAKITFDANSAINRSFRGVGAQWDPLDPDLGDYSDADWEMSFKRLSFARTSLLRVMVNPYYYFKESEDRKRQVYIWDEKQFHDIKFSVQYEQVRRILSFAQKQNSDVFLGQWFGLSKDKPYETRESIDRLFDFFQHLIEAKKFTNIRYISLINEPDGWWTYGEQALSKSNPEQYWPRWQTAVGNLQAALSDRRFAKSVLLTGPACNVDFEWLPRTIQQFGKTFGAYDFHKYTDDAQIDHGDVEVEWKEKIQRWKGYLPSDEQTRPILVTEFGRNTGKNVALDAQEQIGTFLHGIKMADYTVQLIRAGVDGLVIYAVDDRAHIVEPLIRQGRKEYKRWGFWSTIPDDDPQARESRPWFYPMALAMRYFPRGATILRDHGNTFPGLRYIAAKTGGSGEHIAMMFVNNYDADRRMTVTVAGMNRPINLAAYHYFDGRKLFDADGIPLRSANYTERNLANGLEVMLPARSVVVLSSEDAGPIEINDNEPIRSSAMGQDCKKYNDDGLTCEQVGIVPGSILEKWGKTWECIDDCANIANNQAGRGNATKSSTETLRDCAQKNRDGLTCEQVGVAPGQRLNKWGVEWECSDGCAKVASGQDPSEMSDNTCFSYNQDGKTCVDAGLAPGERKFFWNGYWECINGCAHPVVTP